MSRDIYIMIRTHNRPEGFARCIASVRKQTLQPKIIVISDDPDDEYVNRTEGIHIVFRPRVRRARWWIRHHNPVNDYFNQAAEKVPDGNFIYYLDDDDELVDPDWFKTVVEMDRPLLIGRFQLGEAHDHRIIGSEIVRGRIGGSCIAVQSHIPKKIKWPQRGGGDFLFISRVAAVYTPFFIEMIAGKVQGNLNHSWGRRKHY